MSVPECLSACLFARVSQKPHVKLYLTFCACYLRPCVADWRQCNMFVTIRYDTIRDAILTCARKPTWIGLIYRTETTTKNCKTEKLESKSRYVRSNSESLGNCLLWLRAMWQCDRSRASSSALVTNTRKQKTVLRCGRPLLDLSLSLSPSLCSHDNIISARETNNLLELQLLQPSCQINFCVLWPSKNP